VISGPLVGLRGPGRPGRAALDHSLVAHLLALVANRATAADGPHRESSHTDAFGAINGSPSCHPNSSRSSRTDSDVAECTRDHSQGPDRPRRDQDDDKDV
jgi:hypothetical protein